VGGLATNSTLALRTPKLVVWRRALSARHYRLAHGVPDGHSRRPVQAEDGDQMDDATGARLADLDAEAILRLIPHRYPFLLIDRVVEICADTSAVGIKNVTFNEPYFQGHFPGHPIMPGVLIVEAMAQTAAALVVASVGAEAVGKLVYFMSIEQARFRRPVRPGDQLRIKVVKQQKKLSVWKFQGHAAVDGKTAAEAVISAKIMDPAA
jgi:3-hydroxyacyl-[acyl-carrier-protein] dehydratase